MTSPHHKLSRETGAHPPSLALEIEKRLVDPKDEISYSHYKPYYLTFIYVA